MAGEVFISYRRSDVARAAQLDGLLRERGIEPWYDAHLSAGDEWRSEITAALEASQVFVLLYSAEAGQSKEISKELAVAVEAKKIVIPARLEDVRPTGAFLYELAGRQWFDVFPDPDHRMAELADRLAALVGGEATAPVHGQKRIAEPSRSDPRKPRHAVALSAIAAFILIGLIAIGLIFKPLAWFSGNGENRRAPSSQNGVAITVLPFVNLSNDKDQEFFSDGMTEELTSALAKVPGLRVIGRSSAFQLKGDAPDIRAIGRALGVKDLIQGSVRKQGDALRITAKLIRVEDGAELWAESYDRQLKNVFAVQEDIAVSIATALKAPLALKEGQALVANRATDIRSYQDYLQALALERARKIDEMTTVLNALLARDPSYAPAWALLAQGNTAPVTMAKFEDALAAGRVDEARDLRIAHETVVENAARKAIELDPNNATAYGSLASLEGQRGHWAAAIGDARRALALDPNSPEVLYTYSYLLAATGQLKDAQKVQTQLLAEEPFVPVYRARMADVLWAVGQTQAALKVLQTLGPDANTRIRLAKVYATLGRFPDAVDALTTAQPTTEYGRADLDTAARLLRSAPMKVQNPASLPLLKRDLSFVYLFIGADGRSLDGVERQIANGYFGGIYRDPWAPPSAALRKTDRFKDFVRKAGFDVYWRQTGWPTFCRPLGTTDFTCN